ncbi:MAG: serine hydrolase domain-containing protein [Verrucomicrobiota bacterium]
MKPAFASLAAFFWACAAPAAEPQLYFPPAKGDWETIAPAKAGWDAGKLNEALELAGQRKSSGVVVLHRGRIMAERYWKADDSPGAKGKDYSLRVKGTDAVGGAIEDVASVQKSVSAILTGIAQHKGLLRLDDPVHKHLGQGWSKALLTQEEEITIRHLLTMTSGLTEDLTFEAPAGKRWRYNSAAYARTMDVVAAAAKKSANDLTREWLTGRIGMNDSAWAERPGLGAKGALNPRGFTTTARDLARFGLLILANGRWQDQTIIADREFLHDALHPSQELNPSYGYLWWLNGQKEVARGAGQRAKGPLIPGAPPDLVAALGALDRKVYVVPSLDLVVTRLGNAAGAGFDNEFWKALSAAAPKPEGRPTSQ